MEQFVLHVLLKVGHQQKFKHENPSRQVIREIYKTLEKYRVYGTYIGVCALLTMSFFILWKPRIYVLDPVDEVDLFVLHCVYLPRINKLSSAPKDRKKLVTMANHDKQLSL